MPFTQDHIARMLSRLPDSPIRLDMKASLRAHLASMDVPVKQHFWFFNPLVPIAVASAAVALTVGLGIYGFTHSKLDSTGDLERSLARVEHETAVMDTELGVLGKESDVVTADDSLSSDLDSIDSDLDDMQRELDNITMPS